MENQEEKNYLASYSDEYLKDIKKFDKSGNKQILKKIDAFLDELEETPTKGTGQTEPLKGYGERNVYSKRINGKHRFIYEVFEEEKKVEVLSAFGHYNDK